ncbi:hypothetical protein ISG33_11140 [Glaciecola sp. MH2013]|nr:hypothetical protein [Glaciecola sp. MH2013]
MKLIIIIVFIGSIFAGGYAILEKNKSVKLSQLHSGYKLQPKDWEVFLQCWQEKRLHQLDQGNADFLRFGNETVKHKSIEFPNLQDIPLPKSFLDFHESYQRLGGAYRETSIADGIGMFAPSEVQLLSSYLLEYLESNNEFSFESDDESYYKYGVEQDTAQQRTSYKQNAIVVGQYGWDDYELIVLYPDSKTQDGEMETAIFGLASDARTPSFVEMMKQLAVFFLSAPDSMPLYPQPTVAKSCAGKLTLVNVWWK